MKRIGVKLDAPGLQPDSAATTTLLRLAVEYFALLERVADDELQEPMGLHGFDIQDGCVLLQAYVDRELVAEEALHTVEIMLRSGNEPRVRALRSALRRMGSDTKAKGFLGEQMFEIDASPSPEVPTSEVMTLRSKLVRVGGQQKPSARFVSASEKRGFTLRLNTQQAQAICHFLYKDLDITFRADRDASGIVGGELLEHEVVEETGDDVAALTEWFKTSGLADAWKNNQDWEYGDDDRDD